MYVLVLLAKHEVCWCL